MAQPGDTVTYTFQGNSSFRAPADVSSEDISSIEEIKVEYVRGCAGSTSPAGAGGLVENTVADVSGYDTLYIWVAGFTSSVGAGRYNGDPFKAGLGAGSTEISVVNTDQTDTASEPFIAAAGGGASGGDFEQSGGAGARESGTAKGTAPPLGGPSGDGANSEGGDGEGAVSGHNSSVPIKQSGTTTKGGGASSAGSEGEVRITYKLSLSPPDPPSNLTAEQQ
jgi:hypothetical protein